jgi:hypothetical protein
VAREDGHEKAFHPCSLGVVPSSAWRRGLYSPRKGLKKLVLSVGEG